MEYEKETIRWSMVCVLERTAVVELCGWCTKKGSATKAGQRIARTAWGDLTPATHAVLTRAGIVE